MLSDISSALGVWSDVSEQIEYWRDFKGEEIWIRSHSIDRENSRGSSFRQTTYIIKGEVKDVKSFPPGFLLTDVEEILHMSDFGVLFGPDSTTPENLSERSQAQETIREIDEKFVSFDSIDEVERGENVERAEEPFRTEKLED